MPRTVDDERQRAEAWLEARLAPLRELMATEEGRSGAHLSYDEFAAQQRQLMEFLLLPVDHYIGLPMAEAEEVAAREGRLVADRTLSVGGRANWVTHRLNLVTGPDGRITQAALDLKPWDIPQWQPPEDPPPQLTDGGGTLDLLTAESISAALTEIGNGVLEVRFDEGHMVCRYDPDVAHPETLDRQLRDRLDAEAADYVRYVPLADPGRLTQLMSVVGSRSWHPAAANAGLAAGIDWAREVVDVTLNRRTPTDVVDALQALGGRDVVIRLVDG